MPVLHVSEGNAVVDASNERIDTDGMTSSRQPHGRGKHKIVAGLLAVVLGFLGAHHFYLGSFSSGFTVLLMSCFGVGFIVGPVEGVMLLVMSDVEFDAKYNHRTPDALEFVFQQRP